MQHSHSITGIRPGMTLLKAGLLALALTAISGNIFARPIETKTEFISNLNVNSGYVLVEGELIIKGVILASEDSSPLPGANILLKGSEIGTVADKDGRFEFPKKLKSGDVLQITFIGFKTVEYTVPADARGIVELKLDLQYEVMLGDVSIDGVYAQPQSGIRQLWKKVTRIF